MCILTVLQDIYVYVRMYVLYYALGKSHLMRNMFFYMSTLSRIQSYIEILNKDISGTYNPELYPDYLKSLYIIYNNYI